MRAFAGIELPPVLGTQFLKYVRTMREGAELNFVRPEKIHLTLAFFADLEQNDIPKVETALRAAFNDAFSVEITQLSSFSRRGVSSVLFLEAQSEILATAANVFKENLRLQSVAFDDMPFKPHFTLARVRKMHDEKAFAKDFAESKRRFVTQTFDVTKITLFSSNLVAYKRMMEIELVCPEPPAEEDVQETAE